ncbi:hypothetical protein IW140_000433 [Coemansia sp. RSA 1813]|nr:hypothetical protein EV178_000608 [Coemansia sp. RSA 1646]KAJ1773303.1 hypothetical protein LPJ74_000814 [Coemansia sp. RSA 1843]KAJ2092771.1 hypothetical protein IW138_000866 [Coemansia sp. RSA 986]KAJ2217729.1 hypothetical protein EV179_000214 [Coemansia sp. RSA 487]KAJ2573034.1 hypothetical protein IW140_000433 [Coemansia sp. RSA 1813]
MSSGNNGDMKGGEKRGRNDTVTYREFFPSELKRIKLSDPSIPHKVAFKQAGLNWKTSPLNPKNKSSSTPTAATADIAASGAAPAETLPKPEAPALQPAATAVEASSTSTVPAKEQTAGVPISANTNASALVAKEKDTSVTDVCEQKNTVSLAARDKPIEVPSVKLTTVISSGYVEPAPSVNPEIKGPGAVASFSENKQPAPAVVSSNTAYSVPPTDGSRPIQAGPADNTKKHDAGEDSNTAPIGKISSMVAHTVSGTLAAAK